MNEWMTGLRGGGFLKARRIQVKENSMNKLIGDLKKYNNNNNKHKYVLCLSSTTTDTICIKKAKRQKSENCWSYNRKWKMSPIFEAAELNEIVHHQEKWQRGKSLLAAAAVAATPAALQMGHPITSSAISSQTPPFPTRGCCHGDHILCSRPWKSLFRLPTQKKKDRNKLFAFLLHLRFDERKTAQGFIVCCIMGGGGVGPGASKGPTSFFLRKLNQLCVCLLCMQCTVTSCVQKSSLVSNFHHRLGNWDLRSALWRKE